MRLNDEIMLCIFVFSILWEKCYVETIKDISKINDISLLKKIWLDFIIICYSDFSLLFIIIIMQHCIIIIIKK